MNATTPRQRRFVSRLGGGRIPPEAQQAMSKRAGATVVEVQGKPRRLRVAAASWSCSHRNGCERHGSKSGLAGWASAGFDNPKQRGWIPSPRNLRRRRQIRQVPSRLLRTTQPIAAKKGVVHQKSEI